MHIKEINEWQRLIVASRIMTQPGTLSNLLTDLTVHDIRSLLEDRLYIDRDKNQYIEVFFLWNIMKHYVDLSNQILLALLYYMPVNPFDWCNVEDEEYAHVEAEIKWSIFYQMRQEVAWYIIRQNNPCLNNLIAVMQIYEGEDIGFLAGYTVLSKFNKDELPDEVLKDMSESFPGLRSSALKEYNRWFRRFARFRNRAAGFIAGFGRCVEGKPA